MRNKILGGILVFLVALTIIMAIPINVPPKLALTLETFDFTVGDDYLWVSYTTSWRNTTIQEYVNNTITATSYNEGTDLNFTKNTNAGFYRESFYIDGGTSGLWANRTYRIDPLSIEYWVPTFSDNYIYAYILPNKDAGYTVYQNDTSVKYGSLSKDGTNIWWTRSIASNTLYMVGINCNVSSIEYVWCNTSYYNGQVLYFAIEDWSFHLSESGYYCDVWIKPTTACTAEIYENDVLKVTSFSVLITGTNTYWPAATTAGVVRVGILCTDGVTSIWLNTTYSISLQYSTVRIRIFDQNDNLLDFSQFDVYVNGTIQLQEEMYVATAYAYNVTVRDVWGTTINSTTFPFSQNLDVCMSIYKLYIKDYSSSYYYLRLFKDGTSTYLDPRFIAPDEEITWYLIAGIYYMNVYKATDLYSVIASVRIDITTDHQYYALLGVTIDTLYNYIIGLKTMTETQFSIMLDAVDDINNVAGSFGMMIWLIIILITFLGVISFGVVARRLGGGGEPYEVLEPVEKEPEQPGQPVAQEPVTQGEAAARRVEQKYDEIQELIDTARKRNEKRWDDIYESTTREE